MNKTWYNVNINNSRVEQFTTFEEAQKYLEDFKSKCYITKSVYEYSDTDAYEVSETNMLY